MSSDEVPTKKPDDVISLLTEIAKTTSATRCELAEYRNETDNKIQCISSTVDDACVRIKFLEEKLAALENNVKVPNASTDLISVELLKQFNLKNNVCISGLPSKHKENIKDVISAVGKALSVRFGPNDILSAYRAKSSQKSPGLIIIRFANFNKKIELLSSKRKKKTLKVNELGLDLEKPNGILYINNQLTPYFSEIFMKAKRATFHDKIKSCWMASNCVSIITNDDTKMLIKSMGELEAVIGTENKASPKASPKKLHKSVKTAHKSSEASPQTSKASPKALSLSSKGNTKANIVNSTPTTALEKPNPQKRGRKRKNSIESAAKIVKGQSNENPNHSTQSTTASDDYTSLDNSDTY